MRGSATVSTIGSAIAAAGAYVLYTYPPASYSFYPRCVFHTLTGLDCPGCGITRALHHLLHGRVGEAFAMNPMLFALFVLAIFAAPSLARGERPRFLARPWFGWLSLVSLVGFWVGRNVV